MIKWLLPAWKFFDGPRTRKGSEKGADGDAAVEYSLSNSLFKSDVE